MPRVTVLGAGLVGASAAVQLQAALPPGSTVTLLADAFDEATTSWVAAGSFRVESLEDLIPPGPGQRERAARWCRDSARHFARLAFGADGPRMGVAPLPLVQVARERPRRPYAFAEFLAGGVRELSESELAEQFPDWPGLTYGVECLTVLADPKICLPRLVEDFRAAGGIVERRRVTSLEDAGRNADLLLNCSGLAARHLASDPAVHPVRGQVVRVRAPWLKRGVYGPDSTYAYPSLSPTDAWTTVGGCRQANDFRMSPCPVDMADIRARAIRLIPGLATAFADPAAFNVVGLRPARTGGIRVEAEGSVVHCYGHGGNGIALSWGTAKDAVEIGLSRLNELESARGQARL